MIHYNQGILDHAHVLYGKKPDEYVVMVSGGIDSIAAAHFLLTKAKQNISIYHFNHNLREQNNEMEFQVKRFANDHNLHIFSPVNFSVLNPTEKKLRHARMAYVKGNVSLYITAHHLDDAVESHIKNVFDFHHDYLPIPFATKMNGSGFAGSSVVAHPFLFCTKDDLKNYVKENNLESYIVEDETNTVIKGSRRNMIRNKIVPILNEHQISFRKHIKRLMSNRLSDQLKKDLLHKIKN